MKERGRPSGGGGCLGNLGRESIMCTIRVCFLSLDFLYYFVRITINIVVKVNTLLPVFKPVYDYNGPLFFFVLFKKCQIQSIKLKHRNAPLHTQPKNVCKTFHFVNLAEVFFFFCFSKACFDIAMYNMKACNEHDSRVLKSTFNNLPYQMVVNCNTVLFEFGALNAT